MKKIIFILIVMFGFCFSAFAQDNSLSEREQIEKLVEKFFSDPKYEAVEVFDGTNGTWFYPKTGLRGIGVKDDEIILAFESVSGNHYYYGVCEIFLVDDSDFKGLRIKGRKYYRSKNKGSEK